MNQEDLDQIEEELRRKAEEKQKEDMPVSGKSVFDLQRLIEKRPKGKNTPKLPDQS